MVATKIAILPDITPDRNKKAGHTVVSYSVLTESVLMARSQLLYAVSSN